jgi:HSP20 family protein
MALTKWEPFGLDWPGRRRLGLDWPERWRRWLDFEAESEKWLRVEQVKEDGTLVIRAEIPGIDPDKDVEVNVNDSVLHISAKREERSEKKDKASYSSEFRYGEFSRDLELPPGVDKDAVKAEYKDGILEVRIPWPAEVEKKTTKVPVSRS